jgi:DNA-binding NtrC family response regulator
MLATQTSTLPDPCASDRFVIAQVSATESDHESLRAVLNGSCWDLDHFRTYRETRGWLISHRCAVVISACRLPDGTWKDILELVMELSHPPNLIVSSRLADERLWAEVLDLGAYDLLATPFQAEEVVPVVSIACDSWRRKSALANTPGRPLGFSKSRRRQTRGRLAAGAD